ncbi:hypothetical protein C5167_042088 [Papaver somniferum]|nr:hypothetical protein C5167_042088 [Papaver somniferum]
MSHVGIIPVNNIVFDMVLLFLGAVDSSCSGGGTIFSLAQHETLQTCMNLSIECYNTWKP